MLRKSKKLDFVEKEKIIAIIRTDDFSVAENCTSSLIEGGVRCIELTFTCRFAHSMLERLAQKFGSDALIGAGTILDSETARIALLSGAEFFVTPSVNEEVIKLGNRYGVPTFPGVSSATEAVKAMEYGAEAVKLFPASSFLPRVIGDLKAPLPSLEIVPTGGVDLANFRDWLKAGAFACGVGGSLVRGAKSGDFLFVKKQAAQFRLIADEFAK